MADVPSIGNVIVLLQQCRKLKNLAFAKCLYGQICSTGLESHRAVENYIVPMFVDCGSVADAQQIFNRLVHGNVHSWTSLILGYVECGRSYQSLKLYQQMQEDHIDPSSYTLMALVKACTRLEDVEKGKEIHIEIARKELEKHVVIASTLVYMYTKCGSLVEAEKVFNTLALQTVVSWNALISGYAKHGSGVEVLKCFEQMQREGVLPDIVTFMCALKACDNVDAVDKGRDIHAGITRQGLEKEVLVGNTLVDHYARCGFLEEAQRVFDNLPVRDVVSWTVLISGYADFESNEEVLKYFESMQLESVSPDSVTFVCVLKACGSIGAIEKALELHFALVKMGFEREISVGNTLVDTYAKCDSFLEAWKVIESLPAQDVVSWNALIAGYAEHGPGWEALSCFKQMQLDDLSPDSITFVCILKVCGSIRAIDKGQEIHAHIVQKASDRDGFVGCILVDMYSKSGACAEAWEVFDKLHIRTVLSWNSIITGHAEHGCDQEVLECLEQMQQERVSPDAFTFVCVLKACGNMGLIDMLQKIHSDIIQRGFESDAVICSTLIDTYAKCGLIEVRTIFDSLPIQNIVLWTALLAGYAEHGSCQEALHCFEQMQLEGFLPDAITFVSILKVCVSTGTIDIGRDVHGDIVQKGFEGNVFISSTLIDMYAKCASLSEAQNVFDKVPVQDVMPWSAMIQGFGLNHQADMALQCFDDMREQGVTPDHITFLCLLAACNRARIVCKGQELFNIMTEEYGISPGIDHYTCMVDLLAKSGLLHEAEKFLEGMPSLPLWTSLLNACKIYEEAELGLRCFHQLVTTAPEFAAPYVLMGKMYASTGRWDDAYRIEAQRKCAGAWKRPANAMIEVNKKFFEFGVGNSQDTHILAMLEMLNLRVKDEGHVPALNLVLRHIPDEKKRATLCVHAEKLAIAFGLLNTPDGQTLRITKNMRMCMDCHNTFKIISRIEKREIILRDTYCIHHFEDGSCSCGDLC